MIPYQEIIGTQPLSVLELMFTHGFIIILLIIWSPLLVTGIGCSIIKHSRKKKQKYARKKEILLERLKDVC